MAAYQKIILSGSTNGNPISVTALVSEDGTAVHTAGAATTNVDEVWLWAHNSATNGRTLMLHMGATATSNAFVYVVPPSDGLYNVVPGLPFNNAGAIQAHATASGIITVMGYVNRIVSAT